MKTFLFVALTLTSRCLASESLQLQLTPAQQKIQWAQKAVENNPKNYRAHNDLALALTLRAREASDPGCYARAEEALKRSFDLEPDNFQGRKVGVWILLGKHEFAKARDEAKALNARFPDDIQLYGFLVDANVELGNYEEAEKAAQWMLDLRPGNVPGLTRGAYLRELFGDIDGAIEFMTEAYQATAPSEAEELAWILTQIAHLQLSSGKVDGGEKLLLRALDHFPEYHYALAYLAKVRIAQQKYAEAVDLLRQRYRAAPHPENLYELAVALAKTGRSKEAQGAFAEFEQRARAEMARPDNTNRELISYYLEIARKPAEALRIARHEVARRQDVFTLDAFAWALHANGEYAEARRQIQKALEVGIRDAKLLYHAGAISAKLRNRAAAIRYFKQSLDLNPFSEYSTAARESLAALAPAQARGALPMGKAVRSRE